MRCLAHHHHGAIIVVQANDARPAVRDSHTEDRSKDEGLFSQMIFSPIKMQTPQNRPLTDVDIFPKYAVYFCILPVVEKFQHERKFARRRALTFVPYCSRRSVVICLRAFLSMLHCVGRGYLAFVEARSGHSSRWSSAHIEGGHRNTFPGWSALWYTPPPI